MQKIDPLPSTLDLFLRSGTKLLLFVPVSLMFLLAYFIYFLSHEATTFRFIMGTKK